MKTDIAASLIVTVIGGVALSLVDSGWLVGEWSANPSRMGSYTVLALALGAGVHAMLRGAVGFAAKRGEEKAEQRERERRQAAADEKWLRERMREAQRVERMRERVDSLDGERTELLATAYVYGIVERRYDTRDAALLKGMAKLGLVAQDGVGTTAGTWKLTPACRRAMEEMERDE